MEVEGLGARCALSSCRHLDYLPYRCPSCRLTFCDDHRLPSAHSCTSASPQHVPTCPICSGAVPAGPDGDLDAAMSRHIDNGCPKRPRAFPQCALPACRVRDPAATGCRACGLTFCVAHCVEVNHGCTGKRTDPNVKNNPFKKAFAANAKQQQQQQKTKSSSSSSNNRMNKKIIRPFANTPSSPLTDVATKKQSSLDPEEAISLAVFFNVNTNTTQILSPAPHHMRFSTRTSPGRIVDVARKAVPHLPPPPHGKRYAVYAVRRDLSRVNLLPYVTPLRDLAHTVANGDLLVLQVGEQGLDPAYLDAMRGAAGIGPSRFFSSTSGGGGGGAASSSTGAGAGAGTGANAAGRKLANMMGQRDGNKKCIMT